MKRKSIKFAAMTIHEANMRLLFQLYDVYDDREAANIADLVMENVTGWKRIDRVMNKQVKMSEAMQQQVDQITAELLTHKPVQYVLHEAWFAGMKLYVDENVLIPRPETEELVELVTKDLKNRWAEKDHHNKKDNSISLFDIGTGSGCIPIAVKKKSPDTFVCACDVSGKAIEIARKNAAANNVEVKFVLSDILDESGWRELPSFDCIVSNPPYIPLQDMSSMRDNVIKYEPHLALFVPNEDPLLFYRAIARFAERKLMPGGHVYLEIHEHFADSVKEVFSSFDAVQIKKDMQGKERFVVVFA